MTGALVIAALAGCIIGCIVLLTRKRSGGTKHAAPSATASPLGSIGAPGGTTKGPPSPLTWQPVAYLQVQTPLSKVRITSSADVDTAELRMAIDFIHGKIIDRGGTIDKVTPTSTSAGWNFPHVTARYEFEAADAAIELSRLSLQGGKLSVGLESGDAVVGNIGSQARVAYGAYFGPVTVCEYLVRRCGDYRVPLLVGPEMVAYLTPQYPIVEIDRDPSNGGQVMALLGSPSLAEGADFQTFRTSHNAMLTAFRERRFSEAGELAYESIGRAGGILDDYYKLVRERCRIHSEQPPAKDWDGLIVPAP